MKFNWSIVIFLLCAIFQWANCAPATDNGAHPYVGIAYRYVPKLGGYVVCSGSLVNTPSLSGFGSYLFITTGYCLAYESGNGEQFQVTFSQSPGFTRDANTGRITQIDTEIYYTGIGYTEYRLDYPREDAAKNFGFITLNLPSSVITALGDGPSFPATVNSFATSYGFPHGDFTPIIIVGYGFSDDRSHILGDRRDCGIKVAVTLKQVISANLDSGCYLGQSGVPLIAESIIYGVSAIPTISPKIPMSSQISYVRTDTAEFQELLSRVVHLVNPNLA